MKKTLLYVPIVLSLLLFGAHFLRFGNALVVAGIAALGGLLCLRRWWVARLMQFVFACATFEWLRTLVTLVQVREALGEPWLRLAIILGAVAAVTVFAAVLFQARELRQYYRLDSYS